MRELDFDLQVMATPTGEMAKQKGMETRAAMESGIPGSSGTVRLEDLQATVESLVQKALAVNPGTQPPTCTPQGDSCKLWVSATAMYQSLLSLGDDQGPPCGGEGGRGDY